MLIKKNFEDRKELINYLRHIFVVCQKLLCTIAILILIELFYKILDYYQYTAIGIEDIIRSRTIGFIGASGEQSELYYVFVGINSVVFGVAVTLLSAILIGFLIRFFVLKQKIPPIYSGFLPKNRTLFKDLIIPLGLLNGCLLALSLMIIIYHISIEQPLIYLGLGVLPLVSIIILSIRVAVEKNNKFRLRYFLSMAIFILFQF